MTDRVVLTVKETADLLGVSADTVSKLVKTGQLPAIRLGKRTVRIPRAALEQWLVDAALRKGA